MSVEDKIPMGRCALCGDEVAAADVLEHLRAEHDLEVSLEQWPDGSVVIIDQTLEPADFLPPDGGDGAG